MSGKALSVELLGVSELDTTLATAQQLKDIEDVVKTHTTSMWQLAKGFAPVDTGFLRDHIEMVLAAMEGKVSSVADYAIYQELGTRFQAGTPHITPAFEIASRAFISDIERVMR